MALRGPDARGPPLFVPAGAWRRNVDLFRREKFATFQRDELQLRAHAQGELLPRMQDAALFRRNELIGQIAAIRDGAARAKAGERVDGFDPKINYEIHPLPALGGKSAR